MVSRFTQPVRGHVWQSTVRFRPAVISKHIGRSAVKHVLLRVLFAAVTITGLGTGAAQAQAACKTSCMNRKINNLEARLGSLQGQLSSLQGLVARMQSQVSGINSQVSSVSALGATVSTDHNSLTTLLGCLRETPLTLYGDPGGTFGYLYNDGIGKQFETDALSVTFSGGTVGGWYLADGCNTTTVASSGTGHTRSAYPLIFPRLILTPVPHRP